MNVAESKRKNSRSRSIPTWEKNAVTVQASLQRGEFMEDRNVRNVLSMGKMSVGTLPY